jgi:hypothetical protein
MRKRALKLSHEIAALTIGRPLGRVIDLRIDFIRGLAAPRFAYRRRPLVAKITPFRRRIGVQAGAKLRRSDELLARDDRARDCLE